MGRKVLQDHAYVFCQMFMGWRMAQDLEIFASLPDGILTIDVLAGTCNHDSQGVVQTYIAGEISAWFTHQLEHLQIPSTEILKAMLTINLKRLPQPSKRKKGITFAWTCDAVITNVDREYTAHLSEPHTWTPMAR